MNLTIVTDNLRIKPLKGLFNYGNGHHIIEPNTKRTQILGWVIAMGFRVVVTPTYPELFVFSHKIRDVQVPYLIAKDGKQLIYIQLVKYMIDYRGN